MKIRFPMFFIALTVCLNSSSLYAFEYYEDFERYETSSNRSDAYNGLISKDNSMKFSKGFSKRLVSIKGKIHAINEPIPSSPDNAKILKANPSESRKGDCESCVMRFINRGSPDMSKDSWSEERFSLNPNALPRGEKGLTNFWLQYDQYIPKNYHHRGTSTSGGRKVLAIFSDQYSIHDGVSYPTFIVGATPIPSWGVDASYIDYAFQTHSPGKSPSSRRFTLERPGQIKKMIIDPNVDLGHWQRRTLHLRMPTSEESEDGVVEFWVQRLADTEAPMNPEKLLENYNGNFHGGSRNYLNKGYLLGYSNAGYNHDVTILIDNIILSDDVRSIDRSAIGVDEYREALPNSPKLEVY
ncbi:MAG: hypothetical protein L0J48_00285 [Alkalibacterium sp.]|nr:hypothetical protein [Alkalibacterium sp.]